MTASANAPKGANIVEFPAGRTRRPSYAVNRNGGVLDFMQAQAAGRVDIGGWYHEAAVEEERVQQIKSKRR